MPQHRHVQQGESEGEKKAVCCQREREEVKAEEVMSESATRE